MSGNSGSACLAEARVQPGRAKARRVLTFNAVGIVGFGVQTGTLWLLVHALGVAPVPATALAVETAILHNFICHWCWTWTDRVSGSGEWLQRLVRFNMTNGLVSLVVNTGLMALLEGRLGVPYMVSNVVGVLSSAAANFVLADRVVFGARSRSPGSLAKVPPLQQ